MFLIELVDAKRSYTIVGELFFFDNADVQVVVCLVIFFWGGPVLYAHDFGEVECLRMKFRHVREDEKKISKARKNSLLLT